MSREKKPLQLKHRGTPCTCTGTEGTKAAPSGGVANAVAINCMRPRQAAEGERERALRNTWCITHAFGRFRVALIPHSIVNFMPRSPSPRAASRSLPAPAPSLDSAPAPPVFCWRCLENVGPEIALTLGVNSDLLVSRKIKNTVALCLHFGDPPTRAFMPSATRRSVNSFIRPSCSLHSEQLLCS